MLTDLSQNALSSRRQYFAKYGTNRLLIVCEMLINVQKSRSEMLNKMKSDPESTRGSGSPPKVNHFKRVIPCPCLLTLVDVRFAFGQLSCLQNDRQNDHITSAPALRNGDLLFVCSFVCLPQRVHNCCWTVLVACAIPSAIRAALSLLRTAKCI